MLSQGLSEALHQALELPSVVLGRRASAAVLLKLLKARFKGSMLLNVLFHETFYARDRFDTWEKFLLLGIVMVVHGLTPALAVRQEILRYDDVVGREFC